MRLFFILYFFFGLLILSSLSRLSSSWPQLSLHDPFHPPCGKGGTQQPPPPPPPNLHPFLSCPGLVTPCFFFSSSFLFSFFPLLSLFPFNFPRLLLSPSPSCRTFSRTAAFFLPAQLCPRLSPCPFRPLPLPLSLLLFSFIFFSCIAVHFHFHSCSVSSTAWCLSSFLISSLFSFLSYSREVLAQGDPSTWSGLLFGVFIFFLYIIFISLLIICPVLCLERPIYDLTR